jgi:hypothetical protein
MQRQESEHVSGGDEVEFEWVALDDGGDDRGYRASAAGVTALIALLALVAGLALLPTPSVAHASFTAADVNATGNAGVLQSLTVAPDGSVHYDGLEQTPDSLQINVSVDTGSGFETVATKSLSASGREGNVSYSFNRVDVIGQTSLTPAEFRATDGATSTTTLDLRVEVTLVGAGPSGADVTATATDQFTVTVTNEAASAGVHGTGQTDGTAN